MTLNGVKLSFCVSSKNSIALKAEDVKVAEDSDRPRMSVELSSSIFDKNLSMQRGLCDS